MNSWRTIWRYGLAPCLPTAGLEALRWALRRDDPRLLQGATTRPVALAALRECPVEGACAIGWCGWHGAGKRQVRAVEEFFARVCRVADELLGEPAACRHFFDWYDETPREKMRRQLLGEVEEVLVERRPLAA